MTYKKVMYKYGNECGIKTGKNMVLNDFLYDIKHCKPVNIRETKTTIKVYFSGSWNKYSELYILPVSCKKYIANE